MDEIIFREREREREKRTRKTEEGNV